MNRLKGISDGEFINQFLKTKTGRTLDQLIKLAEEDDNKIFLNEYRHALSFWLEHIQDIKHKVAVTLDGRDTAGKGSNIKKIIEYFDFKKHDVKAFGIPTLEEREEWNWFDRYSKFFPEYGNVTLYDRSWYNRALVEAAMSFCSEEEYNWFMANVVKFEENEIIGKNIDFVKVYLSIGKDTQKSRLKGRNSYMKRRKSSAIDAKAQEKWNYYTLAKARMLEGTDSKLASWMVVDSQEKFLSAVEIIKAIIRTSSEVAKLVKNDLSIDLSPNLKIVRTATQELERMKQNGDIERMKKAFKFKED